MGLVGKFGWWNREIYPDHIYIRKSVEEDVTEFCGWKLLLRLIDECRNNDYYSKPRRPFSIYDDDPVRRKEKRERLILRDQGLIAWSFLCGGRINETLQLQQQMITVKDNVIEVIGLPVLKRYEKVDEYLDVRKEKPSGAFSKLYHWSHSKDAWVRRRYKTKPKFVTRGKIVIGLFEPLVPYALKWREECGRERLFKISSVRAYQIVREIGRRLDLEIWPHWFRAQRASQLAQEYGFRERELKKFFSWEDPRTADHYAKLSAKDYAELMKPEKIRL